MVDPEAPPVSAAETKALEAAEVPEVGSMVEDNMEVEDHPMWFCQPSTLTVITQSPPRKSETQPRL